MLPNSHESTKIEDMFSHNWGATPDETSGPVVGDEICVNAHVSVTRCITIAAPPHEVFPWIRQMGYGQAGWYSYDWIDNLGRKSATTIHPEWQFAESGSRVPGGPIDFEAAIVEKPRSFVLRVRPGGRVSKRISFTLAYELRDHPAGTRLVTRMRSRTNAPGGAVFDRFLLGPGDGFMVRKQLRTLARRCETS
ncbi:MAG: hypothetical protein RLZ37_1574 [Actinomycetota bacterium]